MPISKVVYGNQVVIDITDTTATPSDVMYGKYFYMPDGSRVEGTGSGGSGVVVVETTDEHGGTIVDITGEVIRLQTKTATPSSEQIYVTPDSGYIGLSSVTVQAISSEYVKPTGTISITQNGITNVAGYASANVNVQPSISLQSKSVNPSESAQTVTADAGYTALSTVYVGAVSSTYVGSGITRRAASDLVANGSVVTVPLGYYSAPAAKVIAATTHPAPSISVSAAGLITASHTQAAGYVTAGTSTAIKQLTTQAAATITPTTSAQTAVASGRYTTGVVTVAAIPAQYKDISGVTATASDVVTGKSFVNSTGTVNGSLVIQHYYTGSGAPSASLGSNGDIYLKTS